jgi:hypothetical protein
LVCNVICTYSCSWYVAFAHFAQTALHVLHISFCSLRLADAMTDTQVGETSTKVIGDSGPIDPRKFLRDLTEEEKAEYSALRGTKRKLDFRERFSAQKLGKGSAVQTSSMSDRQENVTIGQYQNFWQMVGTLGGMVNDPAAREFAMKLARRVCMACEKKGAPAIMWDKGTGAMAPF